MVKKYYKIEFLIALTDCTWYSKIIDIPQCELENNKMEGKEEVGFETLVEWAYKNIDKFDGDIACIAVYNENPREKDE